jgi:hypothetical protein
MKITSPSAPSPAERRRLDRKRESADFTPLFDDPRATREAGPSAPLTSLGSVLSIQEVDAHEPGSRQRAITRGHALLDELHDLHLELVEGWVSEDELRRLARLVDGARDQADDPRLASVLEDIETRAAIELAKRRR